MKDSDNKLVLEFTEGKSRRRYRMPMIDVRKNVDKEPNIDFDASIEMTEGPFKDILKDASLISSYVAFSASKDA
jgi:hypothetical protein